MLVINMHVNTIIQAVLCKDKRVQFGHYNIRVKVLM